MKKIINKLSLLLLTALTIAACQKEFDTLNHFGPGQQVVLTSDKSVVAPPTSDSSNVVLTLSWTDPKYSTTIDHYKFLIEIDEVGNNFSKASQTTVIGEFEKEFTGRELNAILSGFGFLYDEAHDMEVRVISSYLNNNERYISEPIKISMTAYKEPSTIIEANTMHIIGDGAKSWEEDVALSRIADRVFVGVVELGDDGEFKLRRDAGSWDIDWGIADGATLEIGQPTNIRLKGANLKMPAGSGRKEYLVRVDVNNNTLLVSELPQTMNIIGDGAISWEADVAMSSLGSGRFSHTLDLNGDKFIKFRQNPGDWTINWGMADGESLTLGQPFQLAPGGSDIKIPTSGKYRVEMNLATNTATITASNYPEQLYLVGGGTPADWNTDNAFPFVKVSDGVFEVFSPVTQGGEFKFLQEKGWNGDWGDSKSTSGTLEQNDEQNCSVGDAGFYLIKADFVSNTWSATLTNWGLIGDATPGGWNDDTDMTKESNFVWTITLDLKAGNFKFRANDGWDINLGDNGADLSLEYGGADIPVAEDGNYTIRLDFTPGNANYTYTIQKN